MLLEPLRQVARWGSFDPHEENDDEHYYEEEDDDDDGYEEDGATCDDTEYVKLDKYYSDKACNRNGGYSYKRWKVVKDVDSLRMVSFVVLKSNGVSQTLNFVALNFEKCSWKCLVVTKTVECSCFLYFRDKKCRKICKDKHGADYVVGGDCERASKRDDKKYAWYFIYSSWSA